MPMPKAMIAFMLRLAKIPFSDSRMIRFEPCHHPSTAPSTMAAAAAQSGAVLAVKNRIPVIDTTLMAIRRTSMRGRTLVSLRAL